MGARIYLIRHGETEWSLSGRHTGTTEIPLTKRGEETARSWSARLRPQLFARVLSSPRVRARRTCELAGLAGTMEIDPDLAEWNYGDYEGRRKTEIQRERPDWDIFRHGCPGGESPVQMTARVDRVIARLRASEGNIAVFSHGHFGRVLGARWIGLGVEMAERLALNTASLSLLEWNLSSPVPATLAMWNAEAYQFANGETTGAAGK